MYSTAMQVDSDVRHNQERTDRQRRVNTATRNKQAVAAERAGLKTLFDFVSLAHVRNGGWWFCEMSDLDRTRGLLPAPVYETRLRQLLPDIHDLTYHETLAHWDGNKRLSVTLQFRTPVSYPPLAAQTAVLPTTPILTPDLAQNGAMGHSRRMTTPLRDDTTRGDTARRVLEAPVVEPLLLPANCRTHQHGVGNWITVTTSCRGQIIECHYQDTTPVYRVQVFEGQRYIGETIIREDALTRAATRARSRHLETHFHRGRTQRPSKCSSKCSVIMHPRRTVASPRAAIRRSRAGR